MTKTSQPQTSSYTRKETVRQPLPNRLVRLLSEARWIALAVIFLYFVMILLTYSKGDPGWSHEVQVAKIVNLGGRAGAYLADLLLFIFGFSAWWICVCFLRLVYKGYRSLNDKFLQQTEADAEHAQEPVIRWIGFALLFIGSLGLEYLRMWSLAVQLPRAPGGVLGKLIGTATNSAFGFTGATLLLLLLFGLGFSLFFHVSWLAVAEKIGGAIEDSVEWFRLRYQDHEDRKQGEVAAVKRDEVLVHERAKHVEKHFAAPPVKIEPQVVEVVKSERVQKEKQATLFRDLPGDSALPPLSLLDDPPEVQETVSVETLEFTSRLIEKKLSDFGVDAKVVAAYPGPVVTRYEIEPATGVKGSQIVGLARDLARSLSLTSIRVVETIPGKNYMALELPNPKRQIVRLTEIVGSKIYNDSTSQLTVALGKDIAGKAVIADLAKMPHLLVAGTTGSGKSVGINATILSLLYKSDPADVRMILIDPKMLEMSVYEGIPHLLAPVVTDMRQAGHALNWAVNEMERRYKLMSKLGVRNLAGYNAKIAEAA
ncbi:MAG: DNA translocase FtsK 4TM domain-containing protein, partial [Pseudomonadota bacterium]